MKRASENEMRLLAVVPPSGEFLENRLFSDDPRFNRDNALLPWRLLREELNRRGWQATTWDQLDGRRPSAWLHLDSGRVAPSVAPASRTVLMMIEPEVVAPFWYDRARSGEVEAAIVFTYDLHVVERGEPYRYLVCPQVAPPGGGSLLAHRTLPLVMINGRKYPARRVHELYSERERVASWFARRSAIQIFGAGWGSWSPRHPIAALRTPTLRRAWQGQTEFKHTVLRSAEFVLAFENMRSRGYHTEKLFDALFSGAIPVYLGDPCIDRVVRRGAFIDYAEIRHPGALREVLDGLSAEAKEAMRREGAATLSDPRFTPYRPEEFAVRVRAAIEDVASS